MAESKLRTLSIDFAVQILNLVKFLKSQHETIVSNQIGNLPEMAQIIESGSWRECRHG